MWWWPTVLKHIIVIGDNIWWWRYGRHLCDDRFDNLFENERIITFVYRFQTISRVHQMTIKERTPSRSGTNEMLSGLVSLLIVDAGKNCTPKEDKYVVYRLWRICTSLLYIRLRESRIPWYPFPDYTLSFFISYWFDNLLRYVTNFMLFIHSNAEQNTTQHTVQTGRQTRTLLIQRYIHQFKFGE